MTKKRTQKREQLASPDIIPVSDYFFNKYFPEKYEKLIGIGIAIISIITSIYFIVQAKAANGFFCFPLDDPWIHSTFARNLVEYGSFSYYKNQLITSGSTSPIYTFLLAGLYLFSKNEFIISYILGIGFFALTVFMFFRLLKIHFNSAMWLSVFAALLVAIQPRINLIAVSGMETTMFLFFLVISIYNYKKGNKTALGISLGLLVWCRPDGLILWAAIIADHILSQLFVPNKGKKSLRTVAFNDLYKPFLIAIGFAAVYAAFNMSLSGSLFPNTFRAKLSTYENNSRSSFLLKDVIESFSTAEFVILWVPLLIGSFVVLRDLIKKQYSGFSLYVIFIGGFIFTYWWLLPFSFSFSRYLIPIIPSYIILCVFGIKEILQFFGSKIKSSVPVVFLGAGYFAAVVIISIVFLKDNSGMYTFACNYFNERHVTVGKWIAKNTPENAVIATHDIGAIEFYGNRKIIDMVGLVSPEIIDKMHTGFIGYLNKYLTEKKADYLIILKNWFEVVNDNPVFVPVKEPEIMEVYKYKPKQTHILENEVPNLLRQAVNFLQNNNKDYAENAFKQALAADPSSSKTYFYLSYFYNLTGNSVKSEDYLNKALNIFHDYTDANFMMASYQFTKNNFPLAKEYLERCLIINHEYKGAKELMDKIKVKL